MAEPLPGYDDQKFSDFVRTEDDFVRNEGFPDFGEPPFPNLKPEFFCVVGDEQLTYLSIDGTVGIGTSDSPCERPFLSDRSLDIYGVTYISDSLGIGTTAPTENVDINGTLRLRAGLYDFNNSVGVAGSILVSTGAGVLWSDATNTAAGREILPVSDPNLYYITSSEVITGVSTAAHVDSTFVVTGIGSVGIGTTTPSTKLDILGKTKIEIDTDSLGGIPIIKSIIGNNLNNLFETYGGNIDIVGSYDSNTPSNYEIGPYVNLISYGGEGTATGVNDTYPFFSATVYNNMDFGSGEVLFQKAGISGITTQIPPLVPCKLGTIIGRSWSNTNGGQFETACQIQYEINSTNITGTGNHPSGDIIFQGRSPTNTDQLDQTTWLRIHGDTGQMDYGLLTGASERDLMYVGMADNDFFRIRVGGTAGDAGYIELATSDNGAEPIYVRQYTGVFSNLVRTATLLDGSGNTSFPGTLSVFSMSLADSLTVNTNNTFGSGIILSDDGDMVDLNDGYCSMRFTSGVRVYSGNRSGTPTITLNSGGSLQAIGNITNGGFDFNLGTTDQLSRGNTGDSRALVKDGSSQLTINYANDFSGGTRVGSSVFTLGFGGDYFKVEDQGSETFLYSKLGGTIKPAYVCRAWVSFNGFSVVGGGSGSLTGVRGSGNVSSVRDNNIGDYTIFFSNAMPSNGYAVAGCGLENRGQNTGSTYQSAISLKASTTTLSGSVGILNANIDENNNRDGEFITVTIFR